MSEDKKKEHSIFSPFTIKGLFIDISLLLVLGLWISGFAGHLNPNTWSWLALAGYAFPLFLAGNAVMLVLWLFTKKRFAIIPFIGLLAAYNPVTLYCPIHLNITEAPGDTITVMSYNSFNWARENQSEYLDMNPNPVVEYVAASGADIICMQESPMGPKKPILDNIDSLLRPKYKYIDNVSTSGGGSATIISRYPIKRSQLIEYETVGNVSAAFWLDVKGREVIVINCHLQTMGISMEDRQNFGKMMHGEENESDSIKHTSRTIIGKILDASRQRAGQAETVARFIRAHSNTPMIICGDFNDIPQSYTYNTIANPGKGLDGNDVEITNCYRDTGFGPGYSYSRFAIRERIDNILCTTQLTPYSCKVDKSIKDSDHYPIVCRMAFKK